MAAPSIQPNNRNHWKCYLYDEADCFRFQIEGSLCEEHATYLEQSRRTASSVIGRRSWALTLRNVRRIDPLGRALLRQWSQDGVLIAANSPLLRAIVRSIAGGPEPSAAQGWEDCIDSAVFRIEHTGSEPSRPVPQPLIRRHVETVFLPGSTLAEALGVAPHSGQSECESCLVRVDDRHAYFVATKKRLRSIQFRRLVTIARFCEQEGGVSIDMETIALAWNIPACLRWLTEAFVRLVPRESLSNLVRSNRPVTAIRDDTPNKKWQQAVPLL